MITLYTPPGIGDAYWVLMKVLSTTKESIQLRVASSENFRAHFLSHIDGVDGVYGCSTSYVKMKKLAALRKYTKPEHTMYLEANSWLEAGRRIETYLPTFDTSHRLNWKIDRASYFKSKGFLGKKTIVIQTSSEKFNSKADLGIGPKWSPACWVEIVRHVYERCPEVTVTWMGAKWDIGMYEMLVKEFPQMKAAVDEPADVVMSIMRNAAGVISYQCGLSVISICEAIPTYMIYFDWLTKIKYSFCPVSSVNSKDLYDSAYFSELVDYLDAPARWASRLL